MSSVKLVLLLAMCAAAVFSSVQAGKTAPLGAGGKKFGSDATMKRRSESEASLNISEPSCTSSRVTSYACIYNGLF